MIWSWKDGVTQEVSWFGEVNDMYSGDSGNCSVLFCSVSVLLLFCKGRGSKWIHHKMIWGQEGNSITSKQPRL